MSQGLITYHKVNGISIMKKHVEQDHVDLLFKYIKEIPCHSWALIDWKPTIKAVKCNPKCHIWIFFLFKSIPKKRKKCRRCSWKISCCLSSKVFYHWELLKMFGFAYWFFNCALEWTFHVGSFHQKHSSYICEKNDFDKICATCLGWMLVNHMHFQYLDVEKNS
jgi:hypothetical protein